VTEPTALAAPPPDYPPVESPRRLIGASFDLLGRSTSEMRRASFVIGAIVLAFIGPVVLADWAAAAVAVGLSDAQLDVLFSGPASAWDALLILLAVVGGLVAVVESRNMAAALLGARLAGSPLTLRQALARSRMVFGRTVLGAFIAGIPIAIAQGAFGVALESVAPMGGQEQAIAVALAAVTVGAPFAYVLTGIVLGDVGAAEAVRRSFRVYRARKVSAAVVALFEVVATSLILLGLSVGLDLALRFFDVLGLAPDAGPAGQALAIAVLLVGTFAFGTLVFTATAISIAPQTVMFVGLTHATIGLDHVRPGASNDPLGRPPTEPDGWRVEAPKTRFRLITRPMWLGIVVTWGALAVTVVELTVPPAG